MKRLADALKPSADADLFLLGIPYDDASSFMKGPAEGPSAIREAFHSSSSNLWTELGVDLGETGRLADLGDVDFPEGEDPICRIEEAVDLMLEYPAVPVFLGGDHSVTFPIVKGFSKQFDRLTILHFDAHPDLYDLLDGNSYSHACPFARIMENDFAYRLVQVGIRAMTGHQREQVDRFGIETIEMRELDLNFIDFLTSPLYISFDMDALDPAFAPGVSHHEPGGLSTRQVIDMIHAVKARLVGADIVELNPGRDPSGVTAMAAAKLLKEIMGVAVMQRKKAPPPVSK
mgnify:CR=1 FL=1